jgi:isocitrate/isopropylmalate dehydrogenase
VLDVPDHISLWGLRLAICQPLQQYANVRPTKVFRGTQSPLRNCNSGELDWVIIRENSEGEVINISLFSCLELPILLGSFEFQLSARSRLCLPQGNLMLIRWQYAGHGGISHAGQPWECATEVSIFTRHGVERIMRFAFQIAADRPRKLLTVVTKSNAQRNGMVLWDKIAAEIAEEFPDVTVDKMLVDAMTTRMVLKPETLDTIVATNLVCARWSLVGLLICRAWYLILLSSTRISCQILQLLLRDQLVSLPPATSIPQGRILPCSSPSTAPPLILREWVLVSGSSTTSPSVLIVCVLANPVATFWTATEMLLWLGEREAGNLLLDIVETVCENGIVTKDLGGTANTKEVTAAVCTEIEKRLTAKKV